VSNIDQTAALNPSDDGQRLIAIAVDPRAGCPCAALTSQETNWDWIAVADAQREPGSCHLDWYIPFFGPFETSFLRDRPRRRILGMKGSTKQGTATR
jgi:hypothetical protein